MTPNTRTGGFTLLELLITLAIIGILAAVAYPSYQDYVLESRRTDAYNAILRIQLEEENWRVSHASYTNKLTTADGLNMSATSDEGYYSLAVTKASSTDYTITATAQGAQAGDSGCATIKLEKKDSSGETKTPAGCW